MMTPCRPGEVRGTRRRAVGDARLNSLVKQRDASTSWQARHVSGRHRSLSEKWRSEVLAANYRNTSGSETHCRRARLPSPWERHSAVTCEVSSPLVDLLDAGT